MAVARVTAASNHTRGKAGEKMKKRPARFLTPRRSSGGDSRHQKSNEAASAMAIEVRRRRLARLGFCEAAAL
jgi:hypothetical protein